MTNGWVDEYKRLLSGLAVTEAGNRRVFFEQQVSAARQDLARSEDAFRQMQGRTGVIQIDGQARAMIESAALLRAQAAAKQVEIRAMREFAAEENPELERARQELAGLEGQLAVLGGGKTEADLVAPKGPEPDAALAYERALREVKYSEAMVEFLTRQYEAARVDEARQGAVAQVIDAAIVPDAPSSFRWWWIGLGGLALAFPVAVIAALAAEAPAVMRRWFAQRAMGEQDSHTVLEAVR
jgi:uncharacterized protein involved in exopolysaccharide biosynthesis